ncbi:hypothetical protein DL768_010783 [Monosporascus sp. mg162]|nr:hypothetical protein DL768_010783 [Monosporascus sp. mg162]
MKQTTKKKGEWARREQNRQAQHAFRQRRKIAEDAQRHRIQQLEDSVEEMSNLLIGFCDEMIGTEEIARQPRLMARLQVSMARALVLARSVSSTDEDITTLETEDVQDNRRKKAGCPAKQPQRRITDSRLLQPSSYDRPSFAESPNADASPAFTVSTWDSLHGEMGSELLTTLPLIEQGWPQTQQPESNTISFALRLVKVTLSQACLYLNGDLYLPTEEFERAFGSSLRHRTRDQLLAYLRWLLGPGKNEMHKATGINWNAICATGAGVNSGLFWPAPDQWSGTRDTLVYSSDQDLQPGFMTAVAVQEQLRSLGAKDLDSDIMELKIDGPEFLEDGTASSSHTLDGCQPGRNPKPMAAKKDLPIPVVRWLGL